MYTVGKGLAQNFKDAWQGEGDVHVPVCVRKVE